MSTFVLVHGAWHGAWCWYHVIPRLQQAGHRVIAPDLAGLGRDKTPVAEITLERWTRDVCAILDAAPEPVILVGHSRGGIVISSVAEQRPERIRTLVYVAAMLAPNGKTLYDMRAQVDNPFVDANVVVSEDESTTSIHPKAIQQIFYGECSEEDVTLARLLLLPEPVRPNATPLRLTDERYGRVPRVYIECRRDRAILPALQRKMYADLPCRKVFSIDTDHSPFFSRPQELTEYLLALEAETSR